MSHRLPFEYCVCQKKSELKYQAIIFLLLQKWNENREKLCIYRNLYLMSIKNSPEMPQTELNYELFFCSISQPTSPLNHPNSYLQTKKSWE